jgi:hypothetical protein
MADFKNLSDKIHNLKDAQNLLEVFRILYADAKVVQGLLARYQTDPDYKTAVDYLFTAAQRQELAAMIGQVDALLQDWESNHPSVLGQEGQ